MTGTAAPAVAADETVCLAGAAQITPEAAEYKSSDQAGDVPYR